MKALIWRARNSHGITDRLYSVYRGRTVTSHCGELEETETLRGETRGMPLIQGRQMGEMRRRAECAGL